jgi:hypothetical protein
MRANLDERWLEMIWRHSVLPYVEEQYYDEPQRVAQFNLEALSAKLENGGGSRSTTGDAGGAVGGADGDAAEPANDPAEGVDEQTG